MIFVDREHELMSVLPYFELREVLHVDLLKANVGRGSGCAMNRIRFESDPRAFDRTRSMYPEGPKPTGAQMKR